MKNHIDPGGACNSETIVFRMFYKKIVFVTVPRAGGGGVMCSEVFLLTKKKNTLVNQKYYFRRAGAREIASGSRLLFVNVALARERRTVQKRHYFYRSGRCFHEKKTIRESVKQNTSVDNNSVFGDKLSFLGKNLESYLAEKVQLVLTQILTKENQALLTVPMVEKRL